MTRSVKNRYCISLSLKKNILMEIFLFSVLKWSYGVTPGLCVQQDRAGLTEVVALDGDGDDPDGLRNEFRLDQDWVWFFILTFDLSLKKMISYAILSWQNIPVDKTDGEGGVDFTNKMVQSTKTHHLMLSRKGALFSPTYTKFHYIIKIETIAVVTLYFDTCVPKIVCQ